MIYRASKSGIDWTGSHQIHWFWMLMEENIHHSKTGKDKKSQSFRAMQLVAKRLYVTTDYYIFLKNTFALKLNIRVYWE